MTREGWEKRELFTIPAKLRLRRRSGEASKRIGLEASTPFGKKATVGQNLTTGLRALYDGISAEGWHSNLYSWWLDFLRKLNPDPGNTHVPPAFRTAVKP